MSGFVGSPSYHLSFHLSTLPSPLELSRVLHHRLRMSDVNVTIFEDLLQAEFEPTILEIINDDEKMWQCETDYRGEENKVILTVSVCIQLTSSK